MGKSDSQNLIVKPWSVGFRRPMRKKLSGGLDLTPGLNETLIYVLQFVLRATRICNSRSLAYVFISPNQGRRYPQFLISSVIVYNSFTLPLSLNLLGVKGYINTKRNSNRNERPRRNFKRWRLIRTFLKRIKQWSITLGYRKIKSVSN